MAYNFSAEKVGSQDVQFLHARLSQFELFEFFPVETGGDQLILGISIPFKFMDDPRFARELTELMTNLVSTGFQVVDLFTGDLIGDVDITGLPAKISA